MTAIKAHRKLEKELRIERVVGQFRQMVHPETIAAREGITRKTVYEYLQIARKRAIEASTETEQEHIDQMVDHYKEVIRQAWIGWHRSLEDAEKVTTGDTSSKTIEGQSGNPAFLETISKALWKICELRGYIGKDRDARDAAMTALQPMVAVVVNSRDDVEALRQVQSLTYQGGVFAAQRLPVAASNGHGHNGHQNGDDDDE